MGGRYVPQVALVQVRPGGLRFIGISRNLVKVPKKEYLIIYYCLFLCKSVRRYLNV